MLFRPECDPYVPDGRYRVYGTAQEPTGRQGGFFDLLGVKLAARLHRLFYFSENDLIKNGGKVRRDPEGAECQ